EPLRRPREEERLLAEPVAGEEEPPLVPDREREHAVEPLEARRSPFEVRAQNDFGVRRRREAMPLRFELRTQLEPVVDLAVERDDGAVALHRRRDVLAVDHVETRLTDDDGPAAGPVDHDPPVLVGAAVVEELLRVPGDQVRRPAEDAAHRRAYSTASSR